MNMVAVNSRALAALGHDGIETAYARFHPRKGATAGALWSYSPIAPEIVVEVLASESIGSAFAGKIKSAARSEQILDDGDLLVWSTPDEYFASISGAS